MAGELIWSRAALDDIEAIATLVARDSRIHAKRLVERIFQDSEQLRARSAGDQPSPEFDRHGVRGHGIQGFRVLYERQGEDIHLLAVVHDGRPRDDQETPEPHSA
ncbi:type II toxin-antitoxin system RelE/ParE family toxin [Thiocystis violacea]|uniref:type II toxin-antitoxin system RelE/ParE family toxin n=1 Tax=Thiocystis violacea TaxID=13725 RepID=UPI001905BAF1|nr:type II toxin-antitoxin system RelE/ParE family toxin [Thiocystis violacea]MBK1718026.1 hypothetical protein [Thiocystis violacea]